MNEQSEATGAALAAEPPAEEAPRRKPRRWRRRLAVGLLGLLLLVVCLPLMAGCQPLKGLLVRRLSSETHLRLTAERVSLAWWRPIHLEGIEITTQSGAPVGRVDSLQTSKTLWGLATRRIDAGQLNINSPALTLEVGDGRLRELAAALQQIDAHRGLLRWIVNPGRDVRLAVVVQGGSLSVRPLQAPQWQDVAQGAAATLRIERTDGRVQLDVDPGRVVSGVSVTPQVCDVALKYVAPILARATGVEGTLSLELEHCHLPLSDMQSAQAGGRLTIHAVDAEVDAPLVATILSLVNHGADEKVRARVRIADNCEVPFSLQEGRVHHEGLRFGLPKVLPNLVLQTSGDVGLDQSLDLFAEAVIPFEQMGPSPVLQILGSTDLAFSIQGTLSEPRLSQGDGRLLRSLLREVVGSLTGGQVDVEPLLKELNEGEASSGEESAEDPQRSGIGRRLLERLRQRRAAPEDERAPE